MATELRVEDGPDRVAAAALEVVVDAVRRARDERGVAHVSLSGGNTRKPTYQQLGSALGGFDGVEFWFGDERAVPADDPLSNFKMAVEALGDHPTLHRIARGGGPQTSPPPTKGTLRGAR